MSYWNYSSYHNPLISPFGLFGLVVPIAIFDLILRGFALWKAAKNNQNVWFIVLFLINSAGILPLVYLMLHRDQKPKAKK